jgi:molecular chaperone DnaK (HSP70)
MLPRLRSDLVGGSTGISKVWESLRAPEEPNKWVNPDEVAAAGAPFREPLTGEAKDVLLM